MSDDRPPDPYARHRFAVDIDGCEPLGVTEVRGLAVRVETDRSDESAAGGRGDGDRIGRLDPPVPSATRRRAASPPLSLRRGVSDDRTLWDWVRAWVDGDADPRDVRVFLLDETGRRARGWRCLAATPLRWDGPELVAGRPGVATETLELAHDGIEAILGDGECEW